MQFFSKLKTHKEITSLQVQVEGMLIPVEQVVCTQLNVTFSLSRCAEINYLGRDKLLVKTCQNVIVVGLHTCVYYERIMPPPPQLPLPSISHEKLIYKIKHIQKTLAIIPYNPSEPCKCNLTITPLFSRYTLKFLLLIFSQRREILIKNYRQLLFPVSSKIHLLLCLRV